MNIKELEEFLVICQKGSISSASKELYMSPQGLSRVVKNLENELSCTIMNRTATGIDLTESGKRLYEFAQQTLQNYEALGKEISIIQNAAEGTVELLSAYDIIRYIHPESLLEFQKKYPGIRLNMEEYPERVAERYLVEKKGNVALSVGPFQEQCYDVDILKECRLGVLANEKHPLASQRTVTVQDLMGERIFIENKNFKINELISRHCWAAGFEPNIVFETNGFDMCYKMCHENKGISVTVDFIHQDLAKEDTVMVPFEEPEMVWSIGLLTEKDAPEENSVLTFKQFIKNIFASTE